MKRLFACAAVAAQCFVSAGCMNHLHDTANELVLHEQNHIGAYCAWMECRQYFSDCEDHLHDFGGGFRDGYRNVASGGNGCPPTLPPRKYWCPKYQTPEGAERTVAWFNGFSQGVAAAEADGVRASSHIVTSQQIYRRNCPEVVLPMEEPLPVRELPPPVAPEIPLGDDQYPLTPPLEDPGPAPAPPASAGGPLDLGV